MQLSWRSVVREARIPDAPERLNRDWIAAGVIMLTTLAEIIFRDDLAWPAASLVLGWSMALLLPWRRTKPLVAVGGSFGLIVLLDAVIFALAGGTTNLWSSAVALVMLFALFRWGSGADMVKALPFVVGAYLGSLITDYEGLSGIIGGFIILAVTAESGLLLRSAVDSRSQLITEAKLRERQTLARELHDAVAHHVSAIAIQAQAGQFLAGQGSLDGASSALATIEEEAARALDEMRSMVATLRDEDADVEMVPQRGISAIGELAMAASPDTPRVRVSIDGDLDRVSPSVHAAAYRLAQESITNAVRHARNATRVDVRVSGSDSDVRVTVTDDGDPVRTERSGGGFGLVGMAERAALLGGSVSAGPGPTRGWVVDAVLPRRTPT